MSCAPQATFRLLDARVGWDPLEISGLTGIASESGLMLAPAVPGEVSANDVLPYLFPRRLCAAPSGQWYLAPVRGEQLRWAQRCGGLTCPPTRDTFVAFGPPLKRAAAVAVSDVHVAIADVGAGEVVLCDLRGAVRARVSIANPMAVTLTPFAELWVFDVTGSLRRFGLEGAKRGQALHGLGRVVATRVDADSVWVATKHGGALRLRRFGRGGAERAPTLRHLKALSPSGVARFDERGFCWAAACPGPVADCIDRRGRPSTRPIRPFAGRARRAHGSLTVAPLDGTDARLVWHRVRADADVPPGTSLRFRYATVDADPAGQPLPVHPNDWRTAPDGALDFLIQGLPGRFLALKLELSGDGVASPRVRQVRVDFPRVTSGEQLPGVYFEAPEAADFTQRFLSLFDAELEELDRTIETFPRWLSVHAVPDEALAWLGSLVGLSFDSQITAVQRRALLREAPTLFAERGTVRGLQRVLELVTGQSPAIIEPTSAMGALPRPGRPLASDARLSSVRLFSARATRFKVGRSTLGQAQLRSLGNPEVDPHLTSAWRVLIAFPPQAASAPAARRRLSRLVAALEPAHVRPTVRFARDGGFVVGTSLAGIDTALVPFPAPRLGINTALSRATVLWPSPTRRAVGLTFPLLTQGVNPP